MSSLFLPFHFPPTGKAEAPLVEANFNALVNYFSNINPSTINSGMQYQLAYYATSGTVLSGLTLITGNRALISDVNGLPVASIVTSTELGYLSGLVSDLQPQLDDKASIRLDNLDLTAINQSLVPDTNGTLNIGSSSFQFNAFLKQATFSDTATFNGIVKLANGTVGAPSLTFSTATTDGFYHGSGFIEMVISGVDRFEVSVTNIVSRLRHLFDDGGAIQPAVAFINDVSSGMYLIGFHEVGFGTNSTLAFSINSSQQINMHSHKIINVTDPGSAQDAATKNYVDSTFIFKALTDSNILIGNASNVAQAVIISGDATLANSGALTLATVNSNVGTFTNATITVNAKGLITAASSNTTGFTTGTASTTDNTVTTCETVATSSNKSYLLETRIIGRRTGGSAGSAQDTTSALLRGTFKNVAGTVSLVGSSFSEINTSNTNCTATLTISGTNLLIRVTGDTNNNYSWNSTTLTVTQ